MGVYGGRKRRNAIAIQLVNRGICACDVISNCRILMNKVENEVE